MCRVSLVISAELNRTHVLRSTRHDHQVKLTAGNPLTLSLSLSLFLPSLSSITIGSSIDHRADKYAYADRPTLTREQDLRVWSLVARPLTGRPGCESWSLVFVTSDKAA